MSDPLDIVTLPAAKKFLGMDDGVTDEDLQLADFITGITPVVEREVGPVVAREVTDIIYPSSNLPVPLPRWPVVSITAGALLRDSSAVDTSKMVFDNGMIFTSDSSPMPSEPWRLTYVVGRDPVPQNLRLGALEILDLAWATQRDQDPPAFLISFRAMAWLKPDPPLPGFA